MALTGNEILYVVGVNAVSGDLSATPLKTTTQAVANLGPGGNITGNLALSGNLTVTGTTGLTGNLTAGNATVTLGVLTTGNITTANITTGVITTGNITTANVATGNITALSAMPTLPVAAPAAAGTVQGNATALSLGMNFVTAADGTKGVVLPGTATGKVVEVFNTADGVLKVYPASGGVINALSANAPISQGNLTSARYVGSAAGQWYTDPRVPS